MKRKSGSKSVIKLNAHGPEFSLIELIDRANHGDDVLSLLGTPPGFGDASERVNRV